MYVETTTYANGEVAIFLRGKQYKDGRWVNMPAQFLGLVSSSIKKKRRSRKHRKSWML